jgi:hypothetical protein
MALYGAEIGTLTESRSEIPGGLHGHIKNIKDVFMCEA